MRRQANRYARWLAAAPLLAVGGCVGWLQRGADMLLAPEAAANLLTWQNSEARPLLEWILRLIN